MFNQLLQDSTPAPVVPESRRLRETAQTVSRCWVPCNPLLKRRLQSLTLRSGLPRQELLSVLLSDPGLCIFVLRSLQRLFPEKDTINFRTALAEVELDQLATLLSASHESISAMRYESASRHQTFGLQRSVYTTTAARVFAEHAAVDSSSAVWSSFSKEIGYLLLAWSYPHLYNRAMSRQRMSGTTLSLELQQLLGVTPEELGEYMLREWRLVPGDARNKDSDSLLGVDEITTMASLFACAQDPLYFRNAQTQWEKALPVLTDVLGTDILDCLENQCEKSFAAHAAQLPLANTSLFIASVPESQQASQPAVEQQLSKSSVLSRLPETLQPSIDTILEAVQTPATTQNALHLLVTKLVPALGFSRGCVFSLSKDGNRMLPLLRFGDQPLSVYDEYRFDKYQGMKPLIFQSVPFKRDGIGFSGGTVSYLCGGLESSLCQGVLYLEMPPATLEDTAAEADSLLYFRAIRELVHLIFKALLRVS